MTNLTNSGDDSLHDKVFRYIKFRIISGIYKPGEILLESKLANELGVSCAPIHVAINMLKLEELVENSNKKGVIVLSPSTKELQDISVIHQLVAGLAARWAVEPLSPSQIKELQKILELMIFFATKLDTGEISKLGSRFHQIIYNASGSKILKSTLGSLYQYLELTCLKSPNERLPEIIKEYQAILDALSSKNAENAEHWMSLHIKNTYCAIFQLDK
jgi:DNA-binding GntR family transcriptional regulator